MLRIAVFGCCVMVTILTNVLSAAEVNESAIVSQSDSRLKVPDEQSMKGKTIREVVLAWGNPDLVEPARYFSAGFPDGTYVVVFTYLERKVHLYITREGRVLGVGSIKE